MTSYIDHISRGQRVVHSWAAHTFNALSWQYGPERVAEIVGGRDAKTLADLAAWRRLKNIPSDREQRVNVTLANNGRGVSLPP